MILVLGDGLFDGLPDLPSDEPVWMCESWDLCTRTRHHKQKIVLYLSAMRHFRDRLRAEGRTVEYRELVPRDPIPYLEILRARLRQGVKTLHVHWVNDHYMREGLTALCEEEGVELVEARSPMFLTAPQDWAAYRKRRKRLLMGEFYKDQRARLCLLIDADGQPTGGRWSFDEENRKALPKKVVPPEIWHPEPDAITCEVMALVDREFGPEHPGRGEDFGYAVTHKGARAWLDDFVQIRLDGFGDYEDALSTRSRTLYHGVLTPYLNVGLLTPGEVVERVLERHAVTPVPMNSLEGFLRQVTGWREFIRYVGEEPHEVTNPFGHDRTLNACWWTGETGLPPLDLTIRRARDHAYGHHIERLMVMGSAMLMCEVAPEGVYDWFMEMYVDSADWVMGPNVMGMSQWADGGRFTTKPYLSASAYLRRMGDYPPGPWCEVWDGLFWRFVGKHRPVFERNPRLSAMVSNLDRMDPTRLSALVAGADAFITRTTSAPAAKNG